MLLLWFFLILETACSTTVPTSKILIRHPAYGSCLRTAVGVQFRSYRTGGVKFLRKVVSKTDFECMASVAVKFGTTDFSESSKLAASSGWNSFFFDDQSECWASYFSLAEATEVCTREGVVVYFSSVKLSHFTVPSPTITEFSVTDCILGKSFTVNFRGPCSAYIKYRLTYESTDLGLVSPGDVIEYNVPPCTLMNFTLTPSYEEIRGEPMTVSYTSPNALKLNNATVLSVSVTNGLEIRVDMTDPCNLVSGFDVQTYGSSTTSNIFPASPLDFFVNCSQANDFSSFKITLLTTVPYSPVQTMTISNINTTAADGMTILPNPESGKCCKFIDSLVLVDVARTACSDVGLYLIDYRSNFLLYKDLKLTAVVWIGLQYKKLDGVKWNWHWEGNNSVFSSYDTYWLANPYPSYNTLQCVYLNTTNKKIKNVDCNSYLAAILCIQ